MVVVIATKDFSSTTHGYVEAGTRLDMSEAGAAALINAGLVKQEKKSVPLKATINSGVEKPSASQQADQALSSGNATAPVDEDGSSSRSTQASSGPKTQTSSTGATDRGGYKTGKKRKRRRSGAKTN